MAKFEHVVTEEERGMTINTILRLNFRFSARFRTKIKYQHLIDLNGSPTPSNVKPEVGDIIGVRLPEESNSFEPEDIPLDIIFEDDDLLIVNKQSGITVHPTKGHPEHTLANGITKYIQDTNQSFKIRFANRIDMDTSGIVVVCKNSNAQNLISNQMRRKSVIKKYVALAEGEMKPEDLSRLDCVDLLDKHRLHIDLPIGRPSEDSVLRGYLAPEDGGKDALTEIKILKHVNIRDDSGEFKPHTLVEISLHTGRTHQIRVHMAYIGHRLAGDRLYGGSDDFIGRQALHAAYIEFKHPIDGRAVSFEAPLPDDISKLINNN